jgi:3-deoxy-manno-octulosonate cytidylyltransferase (CMP-KDO synthetase)
VYEAARRARGLDALVVATDSAEIAEVARGFGAEVAMTRADHPSGTDRVAEVARAHPDAEVVVNVQGDLPLLPPEYVEAAIGPLLEGGRGAPRMTTLAARLADGAEESDPGVAKVVADRWGNALYFSRAPIPYAHGAAGAAAERWRQIGIYAFTRETLFEFVGLPPSRLERAEGLEQLRALENGIAIRLVTVPGATPHVDTPEDLSRVEALLRGR